MDNTKKFIMNRVLLIVAIVGLASILGCWGDEDTSTPGTGDMATLPDKVKDCLVGKKIKLTGNYVTSIGALIGIDREATLTEDLFKVNKDGQDELAEQDQEKLKVENWEAPLITVTDGGKNYHGYNDETEEDCHKVTYKRGPFDGPDGQCSIVIEGTVCEDTCTIKDATWELKCGVKPDGTGGTVKASGGWTVEEP